VSLFSQFTIPTGCELGLSSVPACLTGDFAVSVLAGFEYGQGLLSPKMEPTVASHRHNFGYEVFFVVNECA
jgi:hypothetical protein